MTRSATATLIVLWPLWLFAAQAPGRITGTVSGPDGPIAGATVTVTADSLTQETKTDAQGRFSFESLVPGRYEVTTVVDRVQAMRTVTVSAHTPTDITLTPTFTYTSVVVASRDSETLLTAPAAVAVIGQTEIDASAPDTVPGLLQGVPGLNVTQIGGRDFNVNARDSAGRLSNSMLVMVDGRPINQSFYGAVFWDLITVSKYDLDQIEVVRTPASAMWGANALNGAINIRTTAPRDMLGLRGYVGAGGRDSFTAGATFADVRGRFSYKLSGDYQQQEAWPRDNLLPDGSPMPPTARFENRGTRQPRFDARLDWNRDDRQLWSVRGGVAGAHGLIHSALGPGEFSAGSYGSYVELGIRGAKYDVKAYWNRLDWPFRIVLFGLDQTASNDTYAAEGTRQFTLGTRQRLTAGGALKLDRFDISVAPLDTQRVDGAAFIEDKIYLADRVTAIAGARLDKFDTTATVLSPRVGIVVAPWTNHTLRFTYNRAYRAPSLLENFADVALPAVIPLAEPFVFYQTARGSTDLDMEAHNAFELGYVGVLDRRTSLFATVYDQNVSDKIWFVPAGFYGPFAPPPFWPADPAAAPIVPHTFTFVNAGSVRQRGVELGARQDWTHVVLRGSYTFQATPTLENNTTPFALQINRPSRNKVSAGATYTHRLWTVSSDLHYSGRAFWADVLTEPFWGYTESFTNVDVYARYQRPSRAWELWVSGTDVLDRRIKAHVYGDTIRRRVTAGISWRYGGRAAASAHSR